MKKIYKFDHNIKNLLYNHSCCKVLTVGINTKDPKMDLHRVCLRVPRGIAGPYEMFVKVFFLSGVHQRLNAYFKKVGGWHEWTIAHRLMTLGIPISKPLVAKQDGSAVHLPKRSLVAYKWFHRGHNLMKILLEKKKRGVSFVDLLENVGRFVGKIHSKGVLPSDLSVGNILARSAEKGKTDFILIDFEKIFFKDKLLYVNRVNSIAQIAERLAPMSSDAVVCFCRGYAAVAPGIDWEKLVDDVYSASDGCRTIGDRRLDVAFGKITNQRMKVKSI